MIDSEPTNEDELVSELAEQQPMGMSQDDAEIAAMRAAQDTQKAKADLDEAAAEFDFAAVVKGSRPGRVSYRLYSRPDLDVQISAFASDLAEAISRGATSQAREISERIKALKAQYHAASMDVVIEERSSDWQAREKKQLNNNGVTGEHSLVLGLIAEQVESPAGVTRELLEEFRKISPRQIKGLVKAWADLHGIPDKGLPVF